MRIAWPGVRLGRLAFSMALRRRGDDNLSACSLEVCVIMSALIDENLRVPAELVNEAKNAGVLQVE